MCRNCGAEAGATRRAARVSAASTGVLARAEPQASARVLVPRSRASRPPRGRAPRPIARANNTTLFPVLASREAPWRTRGTSTSRARYVVFTRASLRLMRLWTSARVVSRQRPSPTRRRARFRRVSGTKCVFPSFRANARDRHRPRRDRPSPRDFETDLRDPRTPTAFIDRWRNRSAYRRRKPSRAYSASPREPSRCPLRASSSNVRTPGRPYFFDVARRASTTFLSVSSFSPSADAR